MLLYCCIVLYQYDRILLCVLPVLSVVGIVLLFCLRLLLSVVLFAALKVGFFITSTWSSSPFFGFIVTSSMTSSQSAGKLLFKYPPLLKYYDTNSRSAAFLHLTNENFHSSPPCFSTSRFKFESNRFVLK